MINDTVRALITERIAQIERELIHVHASRNEARDRLNRMVERIHLDETELAALREQLDEQPEPDTIDVSTPEPPELCRSQLVEPNRLPRQCLLPPGHSGDHVDRGRTW